MNVAGRHGRAIFGRRHPGRGDRDSRPDPLSRHQADDSRGGIHGRRQEEGRENARDSARRRGRGQFHGDSATRRASNLHQGKIKLSGAPDTYPADDERFFTFRVRPPLKVLLVYDDAHTRPNSSRLRSTPIPGAAMRPIQVEKVRAAELGPAITATFRTLPRSSCSTSSGSMRPTGTALNRYVHEGGGLVVAPGHLSQPENYNQPTASQLLPGQLADARRTPPTRRPRWRTSRT